VRVGDRRTIDRQRLGGAVDRRHVLRGGGEPTGPLAGPARELEHSTPWPEGRKSSLQPASLLVGADEARLVVLVRSGAVVVDLLGQQAL
jgi:hypothetical protein